MHEFQHFYVAYKYKTLIASLYEGIEKQFGIWADMQISKLNL